MGAREQQINRVSGTEFERKQRTLPGNTDIIKDLDSLVRGHSHPRSVRPFSCGGLIHINGGNFASKQHLVSASVLSSHAGASQGCRVRVGSRSTQAHARELGPVRSSAVIGYLGGQRLS